MASREHFPFLVCITFKLLSIAPPRYFPPPSPPPLPAPPRLRRCQSCRPRNISLAHPHLEYNTRESWLSAASDAGVDAATRPGTLSPRSSSCRFLTRARTFASATMCHRPSFCVPRAFLPPKPASFSSTPMDRRLDGKDHGCCVDRRSVRGRTV
jgi:hypothetical protein